MNHDRPVSPRLIPRRRILLVLLVVSLVPLGLLGIGSWLVLQRLLDQRSLEVQTSIVAGHARAIEF